jgi:two-component system, NarL family, sensor histidine kinase UhpB
MHSSDVAVIGAQFERRFRARSGTLSGDTHGPAEAAGDGFAGVSAAVRATCELSPVAVCLTLDGLIVFANSALAGLFGVSSSAHLQGRSLASLLGKFVQRQFKLVTAGLPQESAGLLHHVLTEITATAQTQTQTQTQTPLALEPSRCELRQLAANQVEAREGERRHIAREMHDELGQRLTALKMEMASMGRLSAKSKNERVQAMLEMVDDTVASVRRIASDLRPLMLDDLGLNAAIEWLVRESAKRSGLCITPRLDETTLPAHQEATVGIAIYRITQEALTNVARHAQATRVQIELKQVDGQLHLQVVDNGKGFPNLANRHNHSHGLIGIRERVFSLGGQFEIANGPQGGAQLTVRIPLEATPPVIWNPALSQPHSVRVSVGQLGQREPCELTPASGGEETIQ